MSADAVTYIYICLLGVSLSHLLYTDNAPRWVWRISMGFSVLAGLFFGIATSSFPTNIYVGIAFSLGNLIINFILGTTRYKRKK